MIEIYGKQGCSFCDKAKNLLDNRNIPYNYYQMGEQYTLQEFVEMFPGQKTVPVIKVHGMKIGGYTELLGYVEETAGGHGDNI